MIENPATPNTPLERGGTTRRPRSSIKRGSSGDEVQVAAGVGGFARRGKQSRHHLFYSRAIPDLIFLSFDEQCVLSGSAGREWCNNACPSYDQAAPFRIARICTLGLPVQRG